MKHTPGKRLIADLLTKQFPMARFEELMGLMGIVTRESLAIRFLLVASLIVQVRAQPSPRVSDLITWTGVFFRVVFLLVSLVLVGCLVLLGRRRGRGVRLSRDVGIQATPVMVDREHQIYEEFFPDCPSFANVFTQTSGGDQNPSGASRSEGEPPLVYDDYHSVPEGWNPDDWFESLERLSVLRDEAQEPSSLSQMPAVRPETDGGNTNNLAGHERAVAKARHGVVPLSLQVPKTPTVSLPPLSQAAGPKGPPPSRNALGSGSRSNNEGGAKSVPFKSPPPKSFQLASRSPTGQGLEQSNESPVTQSLVSHVFGYVDDVAVVFPEESVQIADADDLEVAEAAVFLTVNGVDFRTSHFTPVQLVLYQKELSGMEGALENTSPSLDFQIAAAAMCLRRAGIYVDYETMTESRQGEFDGLMGGYLRRLHEGDDSD